MIMNKGLMQLVDWSQCTIMKVASERWQIVDNSLQIIVYSGSKAACEMMLDRYSGPKC